MHRLEGWGTGKRQAGETEPEVEGSRSTLRGDGEAQRLNSVEEEAAFLSTERSCLRIRLNA